MRPTRTPLLALAFGAATLLPGLALATDSPGSSDLFTRTLQQHGLAAGLLSAFLVGLATAATPCVYPMIAITVAVFGARKESRARAMALSTSFVHGIAALFVPLGLVAALSGSVAGAAAGHPAVQIGTGLLMLVMALNMFGLFEISLPGSLLNRLSSVGGLGMKGAFLVGMAMGPIAAPCATAGLVGILTNIAQTRNIPMGAASLYAYSLGLGLPFWLVGSFAVGLPKPGGWMNHIKSALGVVLVVVGLWYMRRFVPFLRHAPLSQSWAPYAFGALAVVGVGLGAVHLSLKDSPWHEKARKTLGISLAALGSVWALVYEPPLAASSCAPIQWLRDPNTAAAAARREGRPLLLDFGATWCAACEELAHQTFRAPEVACAVGSLNAVMVKVYEDDERPNNYDQLLATYRVRGLPTVIVLDPNGREVARETRFIPPREMVSLLHRAEQRQSSR